MNKEQIYDTEISPLMYQILEICKRNKIAMVASFAIPTPKDDGLLCTSCLTTDEYDPPEQFKKAYIAITTLNNFGFSMTIQNT